MWKNIVEPVRAQLTIITQRMRSRELRFTEVYNACTLAELVIISIMYSGMPMNCVWSVKPADSCSTTFKVRISTRNSRKRSLRKTQLAVVCVCVCVWGGGEATAHHRSRTRYSHSNTIHKIPVIKQYAHSNYIITKSVQF